MTAAKTVYVVMSGQYPLAAAESLKAAQDDAKQMEAEYGPADVEVRWDEHEPDSQWRLMSRSPARRRWSWTQYWVAAVPTVEAAAAGGGSR